MMRVVTLCLLVSVTISSPAQESKSRPRSEKEPTYTDPAQAGIDYLIQGEYVGGKEGSRFGLQVIAAGEGQFTVKGFFGGLPGDGWDGDRRGIRRWQGRRDDGKLTIADKEAAVVIADGKAQVAGGRWELQRVVRRSPTEGLKPPPGAVVLFDGQNLDSWTAADGMTPPNWMLEGGILRVGRGDILSKVRFTKPHTIHLEFRLPFMPRARGQARANSGVYIQNRYELQILDSFGLEGKNNEAGGFYSQYDPKINMCYPPLQWQTYDIEFTPARFENGRKTASARATVRHNGVVVQDNVELKGPTPGGAAESEEGGGIRLQDHGDPLMFRNIWVLEKK
jgi:hypothetical protein